MSLDGEAQAVLARIDEDDTDPALVVYDGRVPDDANLDNGYVLLYFADNDPEPAARPDVASLTGASVLRSTTVTVHSVGRTAASARVISARVKALLLDWVPTVSGRSYWPTRHTDGQPPVRDEATGPAVMDKVDVYRLDSVTV